MEGETEAETQADEEYGGAVLQTNPQSFDTEGGNASFQSGQVYWESFARDQDGGEADISVGYLNGTVSVSTTVLGEDLQCGALAKMNPEDARDVAKALQEAASWAEKQTEDNNEPEQTVDGRLDKLKNLIGVKA